MEQNISQIWAAQGHPHRQATRAQRSTTAHQWQELDQAVNRKGAAKKGGEEVIVPWGARWTNNGAAKSSTRTGRCELRTSQGPKELQLSAPAATERILHHEIET